MKIREVKYERLFSFNYENEKIGFAAEVEDDSPEEVLGRLIRKAIEVEEALEIFRRIKGEYNFARMRYKEVRSRYNSYIRREEELKKMIEELRGKGEEKKALCMALELDDIRKSIEKAKKEIDEASKNLHEKETDYHDALLLIKTGNFDIVIQRWGEKY